jgi:predicted phage terminase large subunit-like protein
MGALQYVDIPGYAAVIFRDTYSNLSKPDSIMHRCHQWLANTDAHWKEQEHCYRFPFEGPTLPGYVTSAPSLTFSHMSTPRAHYDHDSAAYHYVAFDEVVGIREGQAIFMFNRIRRPADGPASKIPLRYRCATNPPTREQLVTGAWVKVRYIDPKTRKPGVVFIPARLEDNPYLDAEAYEESLAELDPVTRAQRRHGDWDINVRGRMFDRSWFPVVGKDDIPPITEIVDGIRYWDMAATKPKAGREPAYTAGPKMIKTKQGLFYILDMRRFRENPGETETRIRRTAEQDGRNMKIKMEQEPGSSGKIVIDYYRRKVLQGFTFSGDRVTGPKEKRAEPFASASEAGYVMLVQGAWNNDFLDEADVWPDGPFLDQIDSAAGAHRFLTETQVQIAVC